MIFSNQALNVSLHLFANIIMYLLSCFIKLLDCFQFEYFHSQEENALNSNEDHEDDFESELPRDGKAVSMQGLAKLVKGLKVIVFLHCTTYLTSVICILYNGEEIAK